MSMLDSLFNNPVVKNLAFGQLKTLFRDRDLDFILVKLDQEGEIELELYSKGEADIVVKDAKGELVGTEVIKLTGKTGKKGGRHA